MHQYPSFRRQRDSSQHKVIRQQPGTVKLSKEKLFLVKYRSCQSKEFPPSEDSIAESSDDGLLLGEIAAPTAMCVTEAGRRPGQI